jgi:hypothetical protein
MPMMDLGPNQPRSGVTSITVGEAHGYNKSLLQSALKGRHITATVNMSPLQGSELDCSMVPVGFTHG